jgi:hypothetical protein
VNADKLKKDVGRALRLRPHVQRVDRYTSMVSSLSPINDQMALVDTDYDWYVDAVDEKASMVTLTCRDTGHRVKLGFDNIREYRTPDFLMLKCQLLLEGDQVRVEPR